ncbi:putative HTH-type transcriptional regulator TrpI [Bordetella bronchiseptica CA90 BB1334]|nr:putative HTH-type transcriptional regulator TrpI [Bordetella bronchiseptica OSU054]KCV26583.1 putative HTH-type transcriptional regulator TrpI [Bordetella bronchiseptica 00-P-2730]KDB79145.1 putative HTH-type transcriptional regulator TrpI [Bordetella bronchiseptica CA90 BB1334]KDD41460.1 putative HTH-type transcriptional regulator TrpI [Bordetella bronchiseptica OSU095]KDD91447.1 putative HTH-type transcriptional regulator TrpI [Bordetella bronchiseptica MO275]
MRRLDQVGRLEAIGHLGCFLVADRAAPRARARCRPLSRRGAGADKRDLRGDMCAKLTAPSCARPDRRAAGPSVMSRIPSFTTLRAFEAVARLGNMTRAAEELSVTHSAISKQVQALEEEFGIQLLRRMPRAIEPTPEGARLAATLGTAFGLIEAGINQLRPGPLSLSCSASIMMRWLIPRLANFKKMRPDIDLRVSADHGPVDLLREGIDVAIRNNVVPTPQDVVIKPLMREWVGPVCSPEYASSVPLRALADLGAARLLTTSSRPDAWSDWAALSGWAGEPLAEHESFEHFYLVLHAAACGLGVAMAPRFLVADDLASGRLVAPFGFLEGRRTVVLWITPQLRTREDIRALSDWLQAEALQADAD